MHMVSLILAAEVYHCWEIFNVNHIRHKPQQFLQSRRGFRVTAVQPACVHTAGLCLTPLPSATHCRGALRVVGSLRTWRVSVPGSSWASWPKESDQDLLHHPKTESFSYCGEPFWCQEEQNGAFSGTKSVFLSVSRGEHHPSPVVYFEFEIFEEKN